MAYPKPEVTARPLEWRSLIQIINSFTPASTSNKTAFAQPTCVFANANQRGNSSRSGGDRPDRNSGGFGIRPRER